MGSNEANLEAVRAYHQGTKHGPHGFAPGPGFMDWANQPDPFRRYAGADLLPLPLQAGPADLDFAALDAAGSIAPSGLDAESLSLFLELSMGLTAWKAYQDTSWALRANPSSGNLHPTELTLVAPAIDGLAGQPGIYHYAPRDHGLERLQAPSTASLAALIGNGTSFLAILSSVHWRESWKYGERAFRYCQHDAGHALGAMRYAAALLGWRMRLLSAPSDGELAALIGLHRADLFAFGEAERPELCAIVDTGTAAEIGADAWARAAADIGAGDWLGTPNQLSRQHTRWREIEAVETSAAKPRTAGASPVQLAPANTSRSNFGVAATGIIRRRRSAVAMDGATGMRKGAFLGMLSRTLAKADQVPWDGFAHAPAISLALFVHRVVGLPAGLYLLARGADHAERLQGACDPEFAWRDPVGGDLPLYLLREGDMRGPARTVSCGQDIAADGAFALGMIADFAGTLEAEGPWAYRRLHWETGLIGQVLYLEAEAAGLSATGIGCFFDDEMHAALGLEGEANDGKWQSLYHFTVGGAVEDDRLATLGAYHHLEERRG